MLLLVLLPLLLACVDAFSRTNTRRFMSMRIRAEDIVPKIAQESIQTVLPKTVAVTILHQLRSNSTFWDKNEILLNDLLKSVEKKARSETRTLREIVGEKPALKIANFVEELDLYDSVSTRAFLQSGIVEQMIGEILYEAIFEFLKRADIVGNVVNNMPLIGPIRVQITKEMKKALDSVLGPQVKSFLASFNRVAVQRMIDFVLRAENKVNFRKANRNLIDSVLSRQLSELIPKEIEMSSYRTKLWSTIRLVSEEDAVRLVDVLYDQIGDRKLGEIVDLPLLIDTSPGAKQVAQDLVDKYVIVF